MAGILFFAIHARLNEPVFLLALDAEWTPRAKCYWSDFGGQPDPHESMEEAATREAYEESLGLLSVRTSALSAFIESPTHKCFLKQIKWDSQLPAEFDRRRRVLLNTRTVPRQYLEKQSIRWWTLPELSVALQWHILSPSFEDIVRALLPPKH